MNYIPVTENDKKDMLKQIGVKSIKELFVDLKPQMEKILTWDSRSR